MAPALALDGVLKDCSVRTLQVHPAITVFERFRIQEIGPDPHPPTGRGSLLPLPVQRNYRLLCGTSRILRLWFLVEKVSLPNAPARQANSVSRSPL